MPTQKTRRVLNVFLASPGDVGAERDIAKDVVDRLSRPLGELGWQIELHRWEENKPAYGRPQGVINPSVDACDLFIGLLWERWGQPTGKYSSGFDEEFSRAMTRRQSSGEPEIWLVFKKVPQDRLNDAGPQLQKVIEFYNRQQSTHLVLFKEVSDEGDWERNLVNWLLEYVVEQRSRVAESSERPPEGSPRAVESAGSDAAAASGLIAGEASEAQKQLVRLTSKLSRIASSGNLEFTRTEQGLLQEVDVARVSLLASTWVSRRHTAGFLGIHEINLLYQNRDAFEFSSDEQYQLFRTVVHEAADVAPGWFWFRDGFPDGPAEALLRMAADDSDEGLRARAMRLLASARVEIPADLWKLIPIWDDSEAVATEALKYVGVMGDERALSFIESSARNPASGAAREARLAILFRFDPGKAFSELVTSDINASAELLDAFRSSAGTLDIKDLIRGADSAAAEVKKFSVAELARRGELSLQLAERLRTDSSLDIRQLAAEVIVNKGGTGELQKFREEAEAAPAAPRLTAILLGGSSALAGSRSVNADALALNYFKTLDREKLLSLVDWASADGKIAYRVLVSEHFESMSDVVRGDLRTGFDRIREKWIDDVKAEDGEDLAKRLSERFEEKGLNVFVRSKFTEAGLSGLALHCDSGDVEFGRKHLRDRSSTVQLAAAKILAKFGNSADVPELLAVSKEARGELKEVTLAAAIRLSEDPAGFAFELADSGDREQKREALRWLVSQDSDKVREYFRGLLGDDSESVRELAVWYLASRLTRDEMEELLREYSGRESYYYNVVAWLDRLLYAPRQLREMFVESLGRESHSAIRTAAELTDRLW